MNLNKVMIAGNLTRDCELSYLPDQTALCKFGLAINRKWVAQDGTKREDVTFVDCTAFGKTGEAIAKYLSKGRPVFLEGRLKLDQWTAQDGTKRSKLHVIVDSFQFVDSAKPAAVPAQDDEAPPAPTAAPAGDPGIADDDIPF